MKTIDKWCLCCAFLLVFPAVVTAQDAYKDFDAAFGEEEAPEASEPPASAPPANKPAAAKPAAKPAAAAPTAVEADGEPAWDGSFEETAPPQKAETKPVQQQPAPTAAADKPGMLDSIALEGSLKNETAYRIGQDDQLSKVRNQAVLIQSTALGDNVQVRASQRAYYDAVFDLTDNYTEHVEDDQEVELELRDTYIDYSAGDFDIRFGLQQIVWGEAVGLFIADVVTAKDFREFVLPDFDMIRRPEFGIDADYSQGDFHLELVYIPFPEFDKLGVEGSEYQFVAAAPDEVSVRKLGPDEPANSLDNSQYGTRVTYLTDGWDLGAFYLYTWDKSPVYYRSIDDTTGLVTLDPDYRRQHIVGLTFSKEVEPVVFKGEMALRPDAYFLTSDLTDADGVVRKTFAEYTLGFDYKLWDDIDTNTQLVQRAIFNHDDELIRNEHALATFLSFWAKTSCMDGLVEPEFLFYSSVRELDMMIRPAVAFKLADAWRWKLGADIFEGDSQGLDQGLFGQFDQRSRVYSEILYKF